MREHTIASHFVNAALYGARRQGVACEALLLQAGIEPSLLDAPNARVAPEQFSHLVQQLWAVLDDEYLGLASTASKHGTFAMMSHAIIHCRNLEKALIRGGQFYALFANTPSVELRREGENACLTIHCETQYDNQHFLQESALLIWHRLASWLIGQRIVLLEASFSHPEPTHASEYNLLFPGPCRFNAAASSLLFSAHYLEKPLLRDERDLRRFLLHSPADLLARPAGGDNLSSQIRRLLGHDCRTWPDLIQIAQQLHASPQTLRRHLREEGTSFQELKDQYRCSLAVYHLGRADLPIQAITEQLGFSEPSAFHRAFKKWTGLTPGTYRAQSS